MRSLFKGVLIGLLLSALGVGVVTALYASKQRKKIQDAWAPRKVLVLNHVLPPGTVLQAKDLSEDSYPMQFLPPSLVEPEDRRAVIGQVLTDAVHDRHVLDWMDFARRNDREQTALCVYSMIQAAEEARGRGQKETLAAVQKTAHPLGTPAPVPPLKFDARDETPVVVVTRDIAEGETLAGPVLEVRQMPRVLATPSVVPGSSLASVTGSRASSPLSSGDVLRWQFLEHPERQDSLGGCLMRVSEASQKAADAAGAERLRLVFAKPQEGH